MRARFHGGPFDGAQLALAAAYAPEALYLVKAPPSAAQLEVLVVGTNRIAPGPMFPNAVEYRLHRERADLPPHRYIRELRYDAV
jgi:hypothetical protein